MISSSGKNNYDKIRVSCFEQSFFTAMQTLTPIKEDTTILKSLPPMKPYDAALLAQAAAVKEAAAGATKSAIAGGAAVNILM